MSSGDPPGVDVWLDPNDVKFWVLTMSTDPQRLDSRQLYWPLHGALWVGLVIASILHPIVWIAVAIEVAIVVVEHRARVRAQHPRAFDMLNGRFEVSPLGLRKTSTTVETLVRWAAIERVSQSGAHVLVRFSGTGYLLPFRCFESDEHRQQFVAAMSRYVHGGPLNTMEPNNAEQ